MDRYVYVIKPYVYNLNYADGTSRYYLDNHKKKVKELKADAIKYGAVLASYVGRIGGRRAMDDIIKACDNATTDYGYSKLLKVRIATYRGDNRPLYVRKYVFTTAKKEIYEDMGESADCVEIVDQYITVAITPTTMSRLGFAIDDRRV